MIKKYFEDLEIGKRFQLGKYQITKGEIIRFAKKFDPQAFHSDEESSKISLYGSLIVGVWLTNSINMKLFVETMMSKAHGMGSPGLDEFRWIETVFPNDPLTGIFTFIEKRPVRGNLGLVRAKNELTNQYEKLVMFFTGLMLFAEKESNN